MKIRKFTLAFAFITTAQSAFAEGKISTEVAISCLDNSMIEISETAIGRQYTAKERELKLQAMAANPDRAGMYKIMKLTTNMASIDDVKWLLSTESNMEDWIISIIASCSITGVGWN